MTDYYTNPRLSNSKLSVLARDPVEFKARFVDDPPTWEPPENDSLVFGNLVHCLVLEPHLLDDRYVVAPKVDRRTKEGKETWAKFLERSEGKQVIDAESYDDAIACAQALNNHAEFNAIMGQSDKVIENPIEFEYCGVEMKAKLDIVIPSMRLIVDVKTTRDASYEKFRWSALDYGYDRQAAIYTMAAATKYDGCSSCASGWRFMFAAVQVPTSARRGLTPTVALYDIDNEAIRNGNDKTVHLIFEYKSRKTNNDWQPWYSKGIVSLSVPSRKVYDGGSFENE